ncbi:hypothetical protein [Phormidesmis priestleyi]
MEPLSIAAIATLVLNKGFEEVGKNLGAKALEQGGKLAKLLRSKLPKQSEAIVAAESPEAMSQAVLEVETVAQSDSELADAVRAMAEAIRSQPQGVQQFTNIIGKVANLNQAQTINLTQNFNDF